MLQSRPSTIAGRRHKMVFVDFSNPYLRDYLGRYCRIHQNNLDDIRLRLPKWVADAQAGPPLAAVLDIDEVILSNIHMNSFRAPAGEQGPDAVDFYAADYFRSPGDRPWPRGSRLNPLLPGARELLEALLKLGVRPFLVTGRLESIRDETVENLEYVGLAARSRPAIFQTEELLRPDGQLLMCPDAEYPSPGDSVRPFKEKSRSVISQKYHIVVNIGDQVSDLGLHGDVQVHVPHPFYWTC